MAFSRLYLYAHYQTDALVGSALGLVCSRESIALSKYITGRTDKNEYGTF